MRTTAKRSRHGKTSFERAVDERMERTVHHPAGLTVAQAHQIARTMPGRLIMTERRGSVIVSVFAA
jgi:hypothetical protein